MLRLLHFELALVFLLVCVLTVAAAEEDEKTPEAYRRVAMFEFDGATIASVGGPNGGFTCVTVNSNKAGRSQAIVSTVGENINPQDYRLLAVDRHGVSFETTETSNALARGIGSPATVVTIIAEYDLLAKDIEKIVVERRVESKK